MEKTNTNYNMLLIKNNVTIVAYDIGFFQIKNIYLSETKKNIIMDGKFTKIIYSDELITTHGIFLKIPFHNVDLGQGAKRVPSCIADPTLQSDNFIGGQRSPNSSGVQRPPTELFSPKTESLLQLNQESGYFNAFTSGNSNEITATGTEQWCNKTRRVLHALQTEPTQQSSLRDEKASIEGKSLTNALPKFKQIYKLQSHDILNSKNITDIIRIEMQILEFYKQLFQCKKKLVFMLKEQLQEGNIKLYKEHFYNFIKFPCKKTNYIPNVILKISGIWETADNIGLTYKFIEYSLDNSRVLRNSISS